MSKADEILDVAETLVQSEGYNGFSFRDIASRVGIKSASVHYHYPTKEDLGAAVARRYTDRFLAMMPNPAQSGFNATEAINRYVEAFRTALVDHGRICLCGILGAEASSLPLSVSAEAERFFDLNAKWLEDTCRKADRRPSTEPRTWSLRTLATLEGAMIVSRNLNDPASFDLITQDIAL